ncbi:hypothetical protein [Marinomonas colpomeniae]|uniref:Uncharacterized protein n=1 Tax=Marinomonas colpomeniae TaxID=2774408 RepID=A0ABR8NXK8_9GAMM|nr:hypothetical protein [Marinomonas colpomeniae]MBD5770350.1 hypothetical protein [Marinomonas colpomeniae]
MASKEIKAERGSLAYDGSGINNSPTFNLNHVARFSSLLNPLLERIIENYDPDSETNNSDELPDPDEKLDFNNVRVFSEEIIDCVGFLTLVEEQVDGIDDESPGAKIKFLRAIHQNYKNHRRQLLISESVAIKDKESVISTIRKNSDLLLQQVTDSILDNAIADLHAFPVEDVRDSANLIVCYGFINCKVLERPNDY